MYLNNVIRIMGHSTRMLLSLILGRNIGRFFEFLCLTLLIFSLTKQYVDNIRYSYSEYLPNEVFVSKLLMYFQST